MEQVGKSENAPQSMDRPPQAAVETREETGGLSHGDRTKPVAHLRTTRGGAGSAAGSTPKKAYRPSSSKRPRRAGKKPDAGPR